MPRGKDYANAKIYKLVNDINDDFYVGSTTTSLKNRKCWHKKKGRQMPRVKATYDVIGWKELKIILIEEYPCGNNEQLRKRERYYFDLLKPQLNIYRPWISDEERKYICKHGMEKRYCKLCGGGSLCDHGCRRSQCRSCGDTSICEHNRVKFSCKECGGISICEHGKREYTCRQCGGFSICEHGRIKSRCKYCDGSQMCEHGRCKQQCKPCGGSQICKHGKHKSRCASCGGSQVQKIACFCGAKIQKCGLSKHKKSFNHIYDCVVIQNLMNS